jgi:hypothetical protein
MRNGEETSRIFSITRTMCDSFSMTMGLSHVLAFLIVLDRYFDLLETMLNNFLIP